MFCQISSASNHWALDAAPTVEWFPEFTDSSLIWTSQDQMRALEMIQNDPELAGLNLIQAPLVDVEIRGVPALKFMGDIIWK